MLLMALNVCWTADMTKRSPGRGGRLSSGVLGSCLAFWAKQIRVWGWGKYKAGRDTQILRRQGAEPPGGWQWCEKFSSTPQGALSHPQVSLSLVHSEAVRLCADVMAGLQSEQQKLELESRHDGVWRRVAEGDGERCRMRLQALVGLSRLHLQQSQHGRVVSKFHPPLGGQAHVLSQVVYGSYTETGKKTTTHTRQTGGRFQRHMSYSLSFHFSD